MFARGFVGDANFTFYEVAVMGDAVEFELLCAACGLEFDLSDVEDMDDVVCPECGSQSVASFGGDDGGHGLDD